MQLLIAVSFPYTDCTASTCLARFCAGLHRPVCVNPIVGFLMRRLVYVGVSGKRTFFKHFIKCEYFCQLFCFCLGVSPRVVISNHNTWQPVKTFIFQPCHNSVSSIISQN